MNNKNYLTSILRSPCYIDLTSRLLCFDLNNDTFSIFQPFYLIVMADLLDTHLFGGIISHDAQCLMLYFCYFTGY